MKYRPPLVGEQTPRPSPRRGHRRPPIVGARRGSRGRGCFASRTVREGDVPACWGAWAPPRSHGRRPADQRAAPCISLRHGGSRRSATATHHLLRQLQPWRVKLTRALIELTVESLIELS